MESIDKLRAWSELMDGYYCDSDGKNMSVSATQMYSMVNIGDVLRGMCDEIESEIAERYMELPTDADGVPIKVGDECWVKDTAEGFEVSSIEWNGVCWLAWSVPETRHIANRVLHHKPRTLEDVLDDMLIEKDETDLCTKGLISKYAAEIRELLGVSE